MIRNRKKLMIVWICSLFLMISCYPTRQTTEFRQMKRMADTLVVITPYLEITAYDFREKTPDSLLVRKNKEIITNVTNQVLSSRYVLKQSDMPELDRYKLLALFYDIDNSSDANRKIRQQTFFPSMKNLDNSKLAIFITLHADIIL